MTSRRLFAVLASLALLFAACGDDGGSDDSGLDASAGVDVDGEADGSSGEGGGGDGSVGAGGDVEFGFDAENSAQLEAAFGSQDPLGGALESGEDPTEELRATAEFLDAAADEVPSEIQADVQVFADAYAAAAEASANVDWEGIAAGNPGAAADALQLATAFASTDLIAAATNLSNFAAENCVDVDAN